MEEKIQPAIDRYQNEVRRLFGVLDARLVDREFLTHEYSIADIANWCWVKTYRWSGVDIEDFANLSRWIECIAGRDAVKTGVEVPSPMLKPEELVNAAKNIVVK